MKSDLAPTPSDLAEGPGASPWDRFAAAYLERWFEANPTLAVAAGRHELDGRLPDWSRDGLEGEAARLRGERRLALAFDPAGLDPRRRLERELLLCQLDGDLFWREEAGWPWRNPYFYAAAIDPSVYLARDYAPPAERLHAYLRWAGAVPAAAAAIRANLAAPLPRTYAALGAQTFEGLASYCARDVPAYFAAASASDTGALEELAAATRLAAAVFAELGAWFRARLADRPGAAEGDFRLGAGLFARMLRDTERVEVPLEEIAAAGRTDLERNLAALDEACAACAPGLSTAECMARVQARKPADGPVLAARRQLAGLARFVAERGLVSIPGEQEARVEEAPPHQRWNSAYIDIPGPYERHLPAIYYIAPPDPAWSAEERAAYLPGEAELLFVSAHEVWPGHFLQFLHSNRAASRLAQVFVGYAFAEGWAHYSEEMICEAGFGGGDPETRIGQLQNALQRNVRLLAAIGLHAGDLTVEQAEAMFREQAFHDPASARQQAARGTFDPAYLNYTLGKLMVRKLRDDWTAQRRGTGSWREFHDELLSHGGPPLPLLRQAMLGEAAGPPL